MSDIPGHVDNSGFPSLGAPQRAPTGAQRAPEACWLVERFWLTDAPLPAIQNAICLAFLRRDVGVEETTFSWIFLRGGLGHLRQIKRTGQTGGSFFRSFLRTGLGPKEAD